MNARSCWTRERGGFRKALSLAVKLPIVASALAVVAAFPAGVAAEESVRTMGTVEATATGPGALVNTLGLRSTRRMLAGKYVTIARGQRRLQARVANQLFAEFGVFRDQLGRFKLLGADGRWVKLLWKSERNRHEVGTWANRWTGAWSFKLTRPATIDATVKSELTAAEIDSRQVVCVLAYAPTGAPRGVLAVSDSGVMTLRRTARCGDSTTALFITDSMRKGMDLGALVRGVRIDPITYVRFVPPDRPANSLTNDERRLMLNEVNEYFDMLLDYNGFLQNDVRSAVQTTVYGLLATSYTIPGEAKKDINLAEFFVEQASTVLSLLGPEAMIAGAALKATYNTVELGIALAHNANLEGPRVVESVTNEVLGSAGEIVNAYDSAFLHFAQNLEGLRGSIKEGCSDPATCVSDRKLYAWKQAYPMKNIAEQVTALSRAREAAAHELAIWQKLLPIRGLIHAPRGPRDLIDYPHQGSYWNCSPGYPYNQPYKNEDVLNWYAKYVASEVDPTWGVPVLTAGLYYPYYNWYKCSSGTVHRPFRISWVFGLANDDPNAVTPLSPSQLKRLFDPWDADQPITSGFGLSRSEVACRWLRNPARPSQIGSAGYHYNPCRSAFYNVAGAAASPHEGEPLTRYFAALPYSVSYWTPVAAEIAAGRPIHDPDVVSPSVPDLTFGSCAAFGSGATRSVAGGVATKVYFTNLHDGAIDVYRIRLDGSTAFLFTLSRQNHLARPLAGQGQFKLTYSRLVNTTAGTSFLVCKTGTTECIGTWTAQRLPAGAAVDHAVAEVHGSDGIFQ